MSVGGYRVGVSADARVSDLPPPAHLLDQRRIHPLNEYVVRFGPRRLPVFIRADGKT